MNKSSPESPAKEQPGELDAEFRAIASRHARDAVAPIGSNVHPGDLVVMQEKLRAEEIIFYALKEAAALLDKPGQGWIQVSERLPRRYDTVLAANETEQITAFIDGKGKWCRHDAIDADWTPTHWRPVPPPPERP